jgi:hypothetical protein
MGVHMSFLLDVRSRPGNVESDSEGWLLSWMNNFLQLCRKDPGSLSGMVAVASPVILGADTVSFRLKARD